jgi:hypothetical protein
MSDANTDSLRPCLDGISVAYDEGKYDLCIQLCSNALKSTLTESTRLIFSQFIAMCSRKLMDDDPTDQAAAPSCSFCGKTPPAVRLGAGSSAFICNERVELFSVPPIRSARSRTISSADERQPGAPPHDKGLARIICHAFSVPS